MSRKIANRQATAMLNAPPFEANIGIHNVPFIGFEAVIRQHFARRLNAFSPFFCSDRFDFSAPFPESTPINGPRSASRNCRDSTSPSSFGRGFPVV